MLVETLGKSIVVLKSNIRPRKLFDNERYSVQNQDIEPILNTANGIWMSKSDVHFEDCNSEVSACYDIKGFAMLKRIDRI